MFVHDTAASGNSGKSKEACQPERGWNALQSPSFMSDLAGHVVFL